MQFPVNSPRAVILLTFGLRLPLNAFASPVASHSETQGNLISSICENDDPDDTDDAPTGHNPPGLGVEFETGSITLVSEICSDEDYVKAKRKIIDGRKGDNWMLTADIVDERMLVAEYILNGKTIKLGENTAKAAAEAVANDIMDWDPFANGQEVTIEDSPCKWKIQDPEEKKGGGSYRWQPQITAPLALSDINDLFGKYVSGHSSVLLPRIRQRPMVHVTREFFQSKPHGLAPDSVEDDVLGFFSLVLSYAKAADPLQTIDPISTPKQLTIIMPRTDFTSIYNTIKSSIPGDLYGLTKILACYKNNGNHVEFDSEFCSGSMSSPTPSGQMDKQRFGIVEGNNDPRILMVSDWLKSLQNSAAPDALTKWNKGSIGGLGDSFENILGSNKMVPLFEFRRLKGTKTGDMAEFVANAEKEIIAYHKAAA